MKCACHCVWAVVADELSAACWCGPALIPGVGGGGVIFTVTSPALEVLGMLAFRDESGVHACHSLLMRCFLWIGP
jgi:hypothetical protein